MRTPEIREAPVPVRGWQVWPSGQMCEVFAVIDMLPLLWEVMCEDLCGRSLRVEYDNGQTVIVRAKS